MTNNIIAANRIFLLSTNLHGQISGKQFQQLANGVCRWSFYLTSDNQGKIISISHRLLTGDQVNRFQLEMLKDSLGGTTATLQIKPLLHGEVSEAAQKVIAESLKQVNPLSEPHPG